MAVRQYIGARYVPKYDGDWDATKNYEPLTIVTDANGNSFTSMKDVPAGTALTDRNYWIQTSNFSGAVNSLQRRMSDAETDISTIQTDVLELQTDVSNLNSEVGVLNSNKNTIVLMGDSWGSNIPIIPQTIQRVMGMGLKNYCASGTGFNVPNGYKAQIEQMAADPTLDLKNVAYVILICGLNDHARQMSANDFATACNEWMTLLKSKFSGIPMPPVYWFHNYSLENGVATAATPNGTTYWAQYQYYRTVRRNISGIKCGDCFGFVPGVASAWQDNLRHPSNDVGGIFYSENVCKVLMGEPPIIHPYQEIDGNFTAQELQSLTTSVTARFLIKGSELFMELNPHIGTLGALPSAGSYVVFDKSLPAAPETLYIACGTVLARYDHSEKRIVVTPTAGNFRNTFNGSTVRIKQLFNTAPIT